MWERYRILAFLSYCIYSDEQSLEIIDHWHGSLAQSMWLDPFENWQDYAL